MIYHAYSAYNPNNADTIRRFGLARKTWELQGWVEIPVPDSLVRLFVDDKSSVPYIKDILDWACFGKNPRDIIVFTNSDICCSPVCSLRVVASFMFSGAACCSRREFDVLHEPLGISEVAAGRHYAGLDLFAFRVEWWERHRSKYPDMLIGREMWDLIMFCLMETTNPEDNVRLRDLIYHEFHYQFWSDPRHKNSLKSQTHNLDLGKQWLASNGYDITRFCTNDWT